MVLLLSSLLLVAAVQAKIVLIIKAVDAAGNPLINVPFMVDGVVYRTNTSGIVALTVNRGIHIVVACPNTTAFIVRHTVFGDYRYTVHAVFSRWRWLNHASPTIDLMLNITHSITLTAQYTVTNVSVIEIPPLNITPPELQWSVLTSNWADIGFRTYCYVSDSGSSCEGAEIYRFYWVNGTRITVPYVYVVPEHPGCWVWVNNSWIGLVLGGPRLFRNIYEISVSCAWKNAGRPGTYDGWVHVYVPVVHRGAFIYKPVVHCNGYFCDVKYVVYRVDRYAFRETILFRRVDLYSEMYYTPWINERIRTIMAYWHRYGIYRILFLPTPPIATRYLFPTSCDYGRITLPVKPMLGLTVNGRLRFVVALGGGEYVPYWYRNICIGALAGNMTDIPYSLPVYPMSNISIVLRRGEEHPATIYSFTDNATFCYVPYGGVRCMHIFTVHVPSIIIFIHDGDTMSDIVYIVSLNGTLLEKHVFRYAWAKGNLMVLRGTLYMIDISRLMKILHISSFRYLAGVAFLFPPFVHVYTVYNRPVVVVDLVDRTGKELVVPLNMSVVYPLHVVNVTGSGTAAFTAYADKNTTVICNVLGVAVCNYTFKVNGENPIQVITIGTGILQVRDYRNGTRAYYVPRGVEVREKYGYGVVTLTLHGHGRVICTPVYYSDVPYRVSINSTTRNIVWKWFGNYLLLCTYVDGEANVTLTDEYPVTIELLDMLGHLLYMNRTIMTVGTHIVEAPLNYSGYIFAYWENGSTNPRIVLNITEPTTLVAYYRVPTVITAGAVYVPQNKTHIILKITGTLTDIYGDKIPNATLLITLKINNTIINKKTIRANKDGSFRVSWTINSDLAKWARVIIVYPGSEIYVGSTVQVKPTPSLSLYLRQLLLLSLIVAVLVAIGLALKYLTKGKNKAKR